MKMFRLKFLKRGRRRRAGDEEGQSSSSSFNGDEKLAQRHALVDGDEESCTSISTMYSRLSESNGAISKTMQQKQGDRSTKSISFAEYDCIHPIECLSSISKEAKSERWYTATQLRAIQGLNLVTIKRLRQLGSSNSYMRDDSSVDENVFCSTGLEFQLSEHRQAQRNLYHFKVLSMQQRLRDSNRLASICISLSRASSEQAIALAEDLRASLGVVDLLKTDDANNRNKNNRNRSSLT